MLVLITGATEKVGQALACVLNGRPSGAVWKSARYHNRIIEIVDQFSPGLRASGSEPWRVGRSGE